MRLVSTRSRARGVTLIELMVGMLIGLISTVVIAQALSLSEGRRRTTVSGTDAQVSGALALYAVQREAQMAGYGMTLAQDALGCPIQGQQNGNNVNLTLAPVIITDGGAAGAPDRLTFIASGKRSFSVPMRVLSTHTQTDTSFTVNSTVGTEVGDMMVAVPAAIGVNAWCSIFSVTGTAGSGQVQHAVSAAAWNPTASIFPAGGYPLGSYILNVGQLVRRDVGISANHSLEVATLETGSGGTTTEDLFADVVNLQAYYGKDTTGDGVVDTYNTTAPTTNAEWRQVLAIRVAIVVRSAQMEKENVTASQPQWDVGSAVPVAGSATCASGSSRCVTLTVNTLSDWQRYRYKVYDTVLPLRNMLWQG